MCLSCVSNLIQNAPPSTTTIEFVHHRHCGSPNCRQEGHVHVRFCQNNDSIKSSWQQCNGEGHYVRACVESRFGLACCRCIEYESMWEADFTSVKENVLIKLQTPEIQDSIKLSVAKNKSATTVTECPICFTSFDSIDELSGNVLHLPCGHAYCKHCFIIWGKKHDSCPTCRTVVTMESLETLENVNESGCCIVA